MKATALTIGAVIAVLAGAEVSSPGVSVSAAKKGASGAKVAYVDDYYEKCSGLR